MKKFNQADRQRVIAEVEASLKIKLERVGSRPKHLRDQEGRNFWVLGGCGLWHGIPRDMMEDEERSTSSGVLVVARKSDSKVDIFSGPLRPLIENRGSLARTEIGDYQFDLMECSDGLQVKQVPDLCLSRIKKAEDPAFPDLFRSPNEPNLSDDDQLSPGYIKSLLSGILSRKEIYEKLRELAEMDVPEVSFVTMCYDSIRQLRPSCQEFSPGAFS